MNTSISLSKKQRRQEWILATGMFLMGGIGLTYEYTFSKLASDLLGNSVQQWAIIIGIMMFFMGIGADLQKYLSPKHIVDKLILSEIVLAALGGLGPILLLWSFGHWGEYYILLQYGLICSIGLLIGFEIPLVTRINESYSKELRFNLGRVLKMDYIGALAGALVWIFLLPKWFTLIETSILLGFANLLVALITLIVFVDKISRYKSLLALNILLSIVLIFSFTQAEEWSHNSEQALFSDPIIGRYTSPYQHIVLTEKPNGSFRCYINGHLQFNSDDEYIYHENLIHGAMHIAPRKERILILGGGDGLALREILKYEEVKDITLVDIDPLITNMAKSFPNLVDLNQNSMNNPKVKLYHKKGVTLKKEFEPLYTPIRRKGRLHKEEYVKDLNLYHLDAAKFLAQAQGKYDVIIIDFPDPNSLELAKLYSLPFYQNIKEKLSNGGIMVQQATSPIHAKEAFLCIGRTIKAAGLSALPIHDNVPSFGEWGWWIAAPDQTYSKTHLKNLIQDIEKLNVKTQYLTPQLIKASMVFGRDQLKTNETAITSFSDPKVYHYYLKSWSQSF